MTRQGPGPFGRGLAIFLLTAVAPATASDAWRLGLPQILTRLHDSFHKAALIFHMAALIAEVQEPAVVQTWFIGMAPTP